MTGAAPRLSAYVMAADPWWLVGSIRSYYDLVDKIVVSYDQNGRSWTGTEIPVEECLDLIRELDVDGKCVYSPGHYARLEHDPLVNDTYQRQCALDEAGDGYDWVLQLDTDEVVLNPAVLRAAINEADWRGARGLDFPARWLYSTVNVPSLLDRLPGGAGEWYLERCRRFWGVSGTFPGPVAVRSGTTLRLARQIDGGRYRVDFRAHNTDTSQPLDAMVHHVIGEDDGIVHFSWVRDYPHMMRKTGWSGHTKEYSEPQKIRNWRRRARRPLSTSLVVPLRGADDRFRLTRLRAPEAQTDRERQLLHEGPGVSRPQSD